MTRITPVLLILLLAPITLLGQWNTVYSQGPLGTRKSVKQLQFPADDSVGYALEYNSFDQSWQNHWNLLRTSDYGTTWDSVSLPDNSYRHLRFLDKDIGIVTVGDATQGEVLRTSNGGQNWSTVLAPACTCRPTIPLVATNGQLYLPVFSMPGNTDSIWVFKSTDQGSTWSLQAQMIAPQPVVLHNLPRPWTLDQPNFLVLNDSTFLFGHVDSVYRTTNAGNQWSAVTNTTSTIGFQQLSGNVLVGFEQPPTVYNIFKSTDQGQTWTQQPLPNQTTTWVMEFLDEQVGYKGYISQTNPNFQLAKTTDGGLTWTNGSFSGSHYGFLEFELLNADTAFVLEQEDVYTSTVMMRTLNSGGPTPTSTDDATVEFDGLKVFPNPASTQLTLQAEKGKADQILLRNTLGVSVHSLAIDDTIGSFQAEINIGHLPAGLYFVQILQAGIPLETVPVIIQH